MKKLKLQALELGTEEVLTRVQMKNAFGGVGTTTQTTNYLCKCACGKTAGIGGDPSLAPARCVEWCAANCPPSN